jgi:hypothetical protein
MKLYCSICNKFVAELSGKMAKGTLLIATCKKCADKMDNDAQKRDMPDFLKDIFKG